MSGDGAPDGPQDGLYHPFPPGTTLAPGNTLYIVNEISGTPAGNMQEASEGGVESGAGGVNTNFLSEGAGSNSSEGVALVNPATGEYIIINFSANDLADFSGMSGFPGTTLVGTSNAATDSGVEDQNAGSSYQYNSETDSYEYSAVEVVCYAAGTMIAVPEGERPVEDLKPGDLVLTLDHGAQPIRWTRSDDHPLEDGKVEAKPVLIKAGALGHNLPAQNLIVSPQHRILVGGSGQLHQVFACEAFASAKSLTSLPSIRHMKGKTQITWFHFACNRHEIVKANGCHSESLLLGPMVVNGLSSAERQALSELFGPTPTPDAALNGPLARKRLTVAEVKHQLAKHLKKIENYVAKESWNWDRDLAMEKYEANRLHEAALLAQPHEKAHRVA